jgi:N-methylhydantoinase A
LSPADIASLQASFDREYERLYKRLNPDVDVEALNWRVIVAGPRPVITTPHTDDQLTPIQAMPTGERPAYFPETSRYINCPVYDRYQLTPGAVLRGPAIIEERESTVVVGPGAGVEVDAYRNIVIWLPT